MLERSTLRFSSIVRSYSENFLVKFAFLSCREIDGSLTVLEMCDKTPTEQRFSLLKSNRAPLLTK